MLETYWTKGDEKNSFRRSGVCNARKPVRISKQSVSISEYTGTFEFKSSMIV